MTLLLVIFAYLLNVYFNRWLYFQLVKMDEEYYPNIPAFLCIFLSLVGTLIIGIVYLAVYWDEHPSKSPTMTWFKPGFLKGGEKHQDVGVTTKQKFKKMTLDPHNYSRED